MVFVVSKNSNNEGAGATTPAFKTNKQIYAEAPSMPDELVVDKGAYAREQTRKIHKTTQSVANNQRALMKEIEDLKQQLAVVEAKPKILTSKDVSYLIDSKLKKAERSANKGIKNNDRRWNKIETWISEQKKGLPLGIGFDNLKNSGGNAFNSAPKGRVLPPTKMVTLFPSAGAMQDKNGSSFEVGNFNVNKIMPSNQGFSNVLVGGGGAEEEVVPYFTLPENATLVDNTSLTYLMGVVPFKGVVRNPKEFKLITGKKNLAASGFYLPDEVSHIVWRGVSEGSREMGCVSGIVYSMTFVFDDGTIYTQSSDSDKLLGTITDPRGNPCIAGTYIDNSGQYLQDRLLVASGSSLTGALGDISKTITTTTTGSLISQVTGGKTAEYIAGETLTGGAEELLSYLRDRMDDAIDLVVVEAGQNITIHLNEEITIDYDKLGRKLRHEELLSDSSFVEFD